MFEQKIAETIDFYLVDTMGTRDSISFQTISDASALPLAVKQFFGLHVEDWWEEEKRRIATSAHFDFSPQYCGMKIEELGEFVRPHAMFSREEYRSLLEQYVKRLFNYTFRPHYALSTHIFSIHKEQPVETILDIMSLYTDYPYLTTFLTEWTRNKHIRFLDKEQFSEILSKLDVETIKKLDCKKLANLAKPMFDLYDLQRDDDEKMVPIESIMLFFNDKSAYSIEKRLERESAIREMITMHDLVLILGDVDYAIDSEISSLVSRHLGTALNISELELPPEMTLGPEPDMEIQESVLPEFSIHEEPKKVEPEVSIEDDLKFSLDDIHLDHESQSSHVLGNRAEMEDLPAEFMLTSEEKDQNAIPGSHDDASLEIPSFILDDSEEMSMPSGASYEPVEAEPEPTIQEPSAQSELLNQQAVDSDSAREEENPFFDVDSIVTAPSVPMPQGPMNFPDLREVIPSKERAKFVKKLFKKNEELYESSIDRLNGLPTWREANEAIDDVFIANAVDTYSKYAVAFYDIVYKRYTIKL